jgi:hypothetical protein
MRFTTRATYDDTSLLITIMRRFCPDTVASLGPRAANALDVGPLLSAQAPQGQILQMPNIPPPPPPAAVHTRPPDSFNDVLRKAIFGF